MHWIERSARRKSAESNVRSALACIEAARPSGGPKSYQGATDYGEALALLYLAVRDLQQSDGRRER